MFIKIKIPLMKEIRTMMKKNELDKLKDNIDKASTACILVLYMLSIFGCITLFNFIISKWTNFYPDGFWKFFSTVAIIYAIILCIILVLNVCEIVTCYIMLLIKKRRLKK